VERFEQFGIPFADIMLCCSAGKGVWKASLISYSILTSSLVLPQPLMPVIPRYSANTEGFIKGSKVFLIHAVPNFVQMMLGIKYFNTILPFARGISPGNS
jgi:hypothetical protein